MSRHEKNPRVPVGQGREDQPKPVGDEPLDELEGAEELLKTSFTAGNEMKIAVAVILVLVVVFAAAVVKWMRQSSGSASDSAGEAVANSDHRPTAGSEKEESGRREKSPFASSGTSTKPTVVPAVPGSGSDFKTKSRTGEPTAWTFASDAKPKSAKLQDDRSSTSSPPPFQPRLASREAGSRTSGSGDRGEPRPSFAGWEHDAGARSPATGQQPSDPFRSRPAVEGLRRDNLGPSAAVPPSPNALAPDTSKNLPRSDVGRIGNPSYGLANASRGPANTPNALTPSGGFSLPSAASRSPETGGAPNPLRAAGIAAQGSAPLSASVPPRPTTTGPTGLAPANPISAGRRADGTYVVQTDDNFWSISQRLFGTGGYFQALAKHNANKYPREENLRAGDVILAPSATELERLYPELCPSPARRNPMEDQPRTASVPNRPDGRRTYLVQEGDTLYDIARRELGKASRWREIYDLNQDLVSKHWLDLSPGTQILLPDAGPENISQRPGAGSLR